MALTLWSTLFILSVLWITYPNDFPKMIRDPELLLYGIGVETKRRWMILKLGSMLWIDKQKLRYSLWSMRHIIDEERAKQQAKDNT